MTEEKAREIFQEVMKEKRQVHDLSSDNEILDDENLHKGVSKNVADFLKLYNENSEEAFKEFKAMIDEAEELFKDIIEPSEEDIQWALKALENIKKKIQMQIQTPEDLFLVYSFDEDLKIKIIQFFNADKLIVKDISALCLKAKISRRESRLLHTNCYLITRKINRNQKKLNLVYKIENEKVFFIDKN